MGKQDANDFYARDPCPVSVDPGTSVDGSVYYYNTGHNFVFLGSYLFSGVKDPENRFFRVRREYQKCSRCGAVRYKALVINGQWETTTAQQFIGDLMAGRLEEIAWRRNELRT